MPGIWKCEMYPSHSIGSKTVTNSQIQETSENAAAFTTQFCRKGCQGKDRNGWCAYVMRDWFLKCQMVRDSCPPIGWALSPFQTLGLGELFIT